MTKEYDALSTNQKLFSRVVRFLYKQGKSATGSYGCMYRGDGGTKCAVGCLITNVNYHPILEGCTIGPVLSENDVQNINGEFTQMQERKRKRLLRAVKRSVRYKFQNDTLKLLMALQDLHDNDGLQYEDDRQEWRMKFIIGARRIAKQFNLTLPKGIEEIIT